MRVGLLAMVSISCLAGCSQIVGVQSGAAVLAIPRKRTPVVGTFNAHMQAGLGQRGGHSAIVMGPEVNVRASNDYGHADLGLTLTAATASTRWMGYARGALHPFGVSWPHGVPYYAVGSGLELGGGWAWNGRYDPGRFVSDTKGDAITLSVRGAFEARPAQLQADIFVGLMLGVAFYTLAGARQ